MSGQILYLTLVTATWMTVGFALWKGDRATRSAALAYAALEISSYIINPQFGDVSGETITLVVDFCCAVTFLLLAVRFATLWLGAAMIFQAAQFSLHAYYLVLELPHDRMHAWVNNADDWGILISIVIGTALAMRRRRNWAREEAEREVLRQMRPLRAR
jgi:hypothetical protein